MKTWSKFFVFELFFTGKQDPKFLPVDVIFDGVFVPDVKEGSFVTPCIGHVLRHSPGLSQALLLRHPIRMAMVVVIHSNLVDKSTFTKILQ